MIDPVGTFDVGGMPLTITGSEGAWHLRMPGVPDGFEPGLERTGPDSFRILRGAFDGAEARWDGAGTGSIGPIPLRAVDGPYEEPPGYGLLAPFHSEDPARDGAFAGVLASAEPGARIEWTLPYPKHEFVRWAMGLDQFIFHGSNNRQIDEFQPIRTSIELRDHGERGNLGAVYGTHDGLWSMFFAVVDRSALRGSIRNGVSTWDAADGRTIDTYQFSIHHECLPDQPFTTGALYLLPRVPFRRLPFFPGGPLSNEWVSEETVRPVVSLEIAPNEFPFLDQIGGHDDGPLLAMYANLRTVMDGVVSYRRGDALQIEVEWNDERASAYDAWSSAAADFIPDLTTAISGEGDRRTVELSGPASLEDDIVSSLDDRLG